MKQKKGHWWAAGALVVMLGTGVFFAEQKKAALNENLARVQKEHDAMVLRCSTIDQIRNMRISYLRKKYFFDYPKKYAAALIQFVRFLDSKTESDIRLELLSIDPEPGAFRFTLCGEAPRAIKRSTRSRTESFLQLVKTYADIEQISSCEAKCNAQKEQFTLRGSIFVL